jgi:hypothetical protein
MRNEITTTSTPSNNRAGIYYQTESFQHGGFTKTFGRIKIKSPNVITIIDNSEQWRDRITSDEYDIIPKN